MLEISEKPQGFRNLRFKNLRVFSTVWRVVLGGVALRDEILGCCRIPLPCMALLSRRHLA